MKKQFFGLFFFFSMMGNLVLADGIHTGLVRGVQAFIGAVIAKCSVHAVKRAKVDLNADMHINAVPDKVEQWIRNEMKEFGIPNYENIPIGDYMPCGCCSGAGYAVGRNREILVHRQLGIGLDIALGAQEGCTWYYTRGGNTDEENIALNKILLRSALKEYQSDNLKCIINNSFPLISSALLSLNAVLTSLKPPKSFMGVAGQSLLSVMSLLPFIIPDLLDFNSGDSIKRFIRKRAEEYACRNVQSRLELEMFYKHLHVKETDVALFKKLFFPLTEIMRRSNHGYYVWGQLYCLDRAIIVKKYLDKWDKEHKN